MVAGADICHQSIPVLDVQYKLISKESNLYVIEESFDVSDKVSVDVVKSELKLRAPDTASDASFDSTFTPSIRSGSFSDIGPRRCMEDEHIRIDDLSAHLGSLLRYPSPTAFYGVFDGHGGADAAAYIRKNVLRFFFEDACFPPTCQVDDAFLVEVQNYVRKAFLQADLALADECSVSSSSGATVLTALIFGRFLLVANAGDCRAVLCRKGEPIEMSRDHRPINASELCRIKECGGYVDDGYLNGVLSVTRALGDWDMKFPRGSISPLIAEPEFRHSILSDDDEFLIIGCDGIWDVMSSKHAVSIVRRGLQQHGNPDRSARELVTEALRFHTSDNLTVIVVILNGGDYRYDLVPQQRRREASRLKCCSLSAEALCSLKSFLDVVDRDDI